MKPIYHKDDYTETGKTVCIPDVGQRREDMRNEITAEYCYKISSENNALLTSKEYIKILEDCVRAAREGKTRLDVKYTATSPLNEKIALEDLKARGFSIGRINVDSDSYTVIQWT